MWNIIKANNMRYFVDWKEINAIEYWKLIYPNQEFTVII